MNSGIYQIRNLVNRKIYVGSSVDLNRRKHQHFESLKSNKHNPKFQNSYNKHGVDNFIFEILEYVEDLTKLIEREQHYIDTLKPFYNASPTAGSNLGFKHSEESKEKSRNSNRTTYSNPEIRAKLSKALKGNPLLKHKGRKISDTHKKRISECKIGSVVSQEVREKISSTLKGRVISEEVRKNMSQPRSEEHRRNIGLGHIGKKHTEESKKKMSDSKKKTVEEFLEKFNFISDDDINQSYKFLREKYSLSPTTISKLKKTRI